MSALDSLSSLVQVINVSFWPLHTALISHWNFFVTGIVESTWSSLLNTKNVVWLCFVFSNRSSAVSYFVNLCFAIIQREDSTVRTLAFWLTVAEILNVLWSIHHFSVACSCNCNSLICFRFMRETVAENNMAGGVEKVEWSYFLVVVNL